MVRFSTWFLFVYLLSIFFSPSLSSLKAKDISSAQWMKDMKSVIGDKYFNDIIIPGTHDSATYTLENTFGKKQDIDDKLNNLKYVGIGFAITDIAKKWAKAQSLDIFNQLYFGARYLDLRVIYRDSKKEFYTVHGLYGPPLRKVLSDIRRFLKNNKKELLIIQIGDLRYMPKGQKSHDELIMVVKEYIGKFLMSTKEVSSPKTKLNDIWDKNKQVMLIYNHAPTAEKYDFLYKSGQTIRSAWPNKQDSPSLKRWLDTEVKKKRDENKFHVLQMQMTADIETIKNALNPFSKGFTSLEGMALHVNALSDAWLSDFKKHNANIIIHDFATKDTLRKIFLLNRTD